MTTGYLIKGDVLGIQSFIFNVSSKGAARSLKSRSYYVQLVQELGCQFLQEKLKTITHSFSVIYAGGGSFYIEVNIDNESSDIVSFLTSCQQEIDSELCTGEIYLSLSLVELKGSSSFGEDWERLRYEGNKNKLRPFFHSFDKVFEPFDFQTNPNESGIGKWVSVVKTLYGSLPKGRWFQNLRDLSQDKCYLFKQSVQNQFESDSKSIIAHLPKWSKQLLLEHQEIISNLAGQNDQNEKSYDTPVENSIIDFDYLGAFAKNRTGTDKLGVLKMDVDNLGQLFKDKSKDDLKNTSGSLSKFFSEEIFNIWKGEVDKWNNKIAFETNIYTVFTGGDDCFFIGSWDAVLLFALEVNKKFKGSFPENSLSAGIIVVDQSFPVVQFSKLVEEAISLAKSRTGKNSIVLFNEVFSWQEFEDIIGLCEVLHELITKREESRALLERIKRSALGIERLQFKAAKNKVDFPAVWRLKYYLKNAKSEINREIIEREIFKDYGDSLINTFMKKSTTNVMKYPVAARITEFLTRKQGG